MRVLSRVLLAMSFADLLVLLFADVVPAKVLSHFSKVPEPLAGGGLAAGRAEVHVDGGALFTLLRQPAPTGVVREFARELPNMGGVPCNVQ